ncbi:MAG: hypothetical protein RLZZ401_699 [Pseudomonadota bacterium]|jgi:4-amino-4-deoxy-L-arabinose transferase-like glycosyltransferase
MDLSAQILIKKSGIGISDAAWLLLFLIFLVCYGAGLDSLYLPSNGDEMVYSRIARLTGQSGHWLPLVSDLGAMRNTKPPLLFWQAMLAGDWGAQWDLWRLRLPSVLYTLGIAGCVAASAWWASRRHDLALIAACVYLAFFSSFRYGRPYLTSAAETFWLTLPLWAALWRRAALPGWAAFAGFGLVWGLGLLYKSFALVLPAAAGLWCALLALHSEGHWRRDGRQLLAISLRVALSGTIALAVFALWFALDPDPRAVWQEFVLGENAGKLGATAQPLATQLKDIAVQSLAWLENAGTLAFAVLGLVLGGVHTLVRNPSALRQTDRLTLALLAWALVWLLVFCLPSQRSARYVIPAMPALALLLALHWTRLPRLWFTATLLLCALLLLLLGSIAHSLSTLGIASAAASLGSLVVFGTGMAVLGFGLWHPAGTRWSAVAATALVYALLNSSLAPLSGPAGRFALDTVTLPASAGLAVPSTFNAQYERYQFLLPGAAAWRITPYAPRDDASQLPGLLQQHAMVVWQTPDASTRPACSLTQPASCQVLATRWDLKTRHAPGEIRLDNLFDPAQWLLRREWLLTRAP